MKFVIQKDYTGRERASLILHSQADILYAYKASEYPDHIPLGSVEFVEEVIGQHTPNYYPEWTKSAWHRHIGTDIKTTPVFLKPSDRYKRFDGYIEECGFSHIHTENIIQSEVVNFVDEWRYYVANGVVLCSWWYQGNEETGETQPHGPELPFIIPSNFCGAIDMGMLDTVDFALVEVQHPYAIGWYGDNTKEDVSDYVAFLSEGYKSLLT